MDDSMSENETVCAEHEPSVAFYAWSAADTELYPPITAEPGPDNPWPRRIAWSTVVLVFGTMTGSLVWASDRFGGQGAYVNTPVLQPTTTTEPPPPVLLSPPPPVTETLPPVTETVTPPEPTYIHTPEPTYIPPAPVALPPQTVTVAPPPPPPPPVYMWLRLPFVTIPIPINLPPPLPPPSP